MPKILGGRPNPNSSTLTPDFLAVTKCPSSWIKTKSPKITTKTMKANSIMENLNRHYFFFFIFAELFDSIILFFCKFIYFFEKIVLVILGYFFIFFSLEDIFSDFIAD